MADPILPTEIRPTLDRLLVGPLLLAVSGGTDSLTLMALVADWRAAQADGSPPSVLVATVDHGLRPASASEARHVASLAAGFGFPHVTLAWTGPKPTSGIQATARQARYRLLADAAMTDGLGRRIVTAHHADDLAETLLLRLARGSGVRGLGGMAEYAVLPLSRLERAERGEQTLVRPLLGFAKARLAATLAARGIAPLEDPSNHDPRFERVRWREAALALAALGLDGAMLALSARRLARAEQAIAAAADRLIAAAVTHPAGACALLDGAALRAAPDEVGVRVLERLLAMHGGQEEASGLAQVEALHAVLCRSCPATVVTTLGGTLVSRPAKGPDGREPSVRIVREMRAGGLGRVTLAPGARAIWDLRFMVIAGPRLTAPLEVAALGHADARGLRETGAAVEIPLEAAAALPAFRRGERLLAVPSLSWRTPDGPDPGELQVEFLRMDR